MRRQTTAVAWIDAPPPHGRWGHPDVLALPLADRAVQLADGLFETVMVEGGRPCLLAEHLARWRASAEVLGMAPPPAADVVEPLIGEAIRRLARSLQFLDPEDLRPKGGPDPGGIGAVLRLNWSRGLGEGGGCRGIDLPAAGEQPLRPRLWLQLSPWQPTFAPVHVIVSRHERRNAHSRLSRCKTFAYGPSVAARIEARAAGADDALLLSTTGELCCGTTANLLVKRGDRWLTPPLSSGCLPGVMRGEALAKGLVEEAPLDPQLLQHSEGALLINSLGCRPIVGCDGQPLPLVRQAEGFWRSLLDADTLHREGVSLVGPSDRELQR